MYFCYIVFPLGKGCDPSFKQTWIPTTQGYFVPSLVEIGRALQEIFLNFVNVVLLFHNYLPLEKDKALYLKKNMNPHHPKMIYAKFDWTMVQWF